jgi:AAA+ ATPase superfamily predicted ATPase
MDIAKPVDLFDREAEWSELTSFVGNPAIGATLAIVYGRRRQGKTLLLELLAEATGGFMFTGLEQSSSQNLAAISHAYAQHRRLDVPVTFTSWEQAIEALVGLGERDAPETVVLDELPYLLAGSPEIPSLLQRSLSPRSRARRTSRTRFVLCGSAFSVMGRLLGGTAALRGRAGRELIVHPFEYRDAAAFWDVSDRALALQLDALVGGTPAYKDFSEGDHPTSLVDFDAWVVRRLLNPATAYFREGRVLLAEEPEVTDVGLYFSVLSAIAKGKTRRGQIAAALGRPESALAHPLTVLTETRLVERHQDPLRSNRSTFRICEPMLRFHQLVIAPHEGRLTRRRGADVWAETADTVASRIYGPHFEEVARQWTAVHASQSTLGGRASRVGTTVVSCRRHGSQHEVDVVAMETAPRVPDRLLMIGEAKWSAEATGLPHLERLHHIRELVGAPDGSTRLALFSRSGFTRELIRKAAASQDVELVDLERLYFGT